MPEPITIGIRAFRENWKDVHPVERRVRGNRRAGRGEDRRGQVHRDRDLARHRSSGNVAGPADDRRHTDASFPQAGLEVKKGRVAREPLATVVVGEDDDGIVGEAQAVERAHDVADAAVRALQNRHVLRTRARVLVEWTQVSAMIDGNGW